MRYERVILGCIAMAAVGLITVTAAQQRVRTRLSVTAAAASRDTMIQLTAERRLLLAHLGTAMMTRTDTAADLRGINALTGDTIRLEASDIDVLYVMSANCLGSVDNLPLLTVLHNSGQRVFAVSNVDGAAALGAFARTHSLPFPMLTQASGSLFQNLRGGPTPTTLQFRGGMLSDIHIGALAHLGGTIGK